MRAPPSFGRASRNRNGRQEAHFGEKVFRKLHEADRLLAEGRTVAEVAEALEISERTPSAVGATCTAG
jgi:DNA-binding NarL/FixJ family response regulator